MLQMQGLFPVSTTESLLRRTVLSAATILAPSRIQHLPSYAEVNAEPDLQEAAFEALNTLVSCCSSLHLVGVGASYGYLQACSCLVRQLLQYLFSATSLWCILISLPALFVLQLWSLYGAACACYLRCLPQTKMQSSACTLIDCFLVPSIY